MSKKFEDHYSEKWRNQVLWALRQDARRLLFKLGRLIMSVYVRVDRFRDTIPECQHRVVRVPAGKSLYAQCQICFDDIEIQSQKRLR